MEDAEPGCRRPPATPARPRRCCHGSGAAPPARAQARVGPDGVRAPPGWGGWEHLGPPTAGSGKRGPAVGTARPLPGLRAGSRAAECPVLHPPVPPLLRCQHQWCYCPTASAIPEPATDLFLNEKTIPPSIHNAETLAGQLEGSGWQIPNFWS